MTFFQFFPHFQRFRSQWSMAHQRSWFIEYQLDVLGLEFCGSFDQAGSDACWPGFSWSLAMWWCLGSLSDESLPMSRYAPICKGLLVLCQSPSWGLQMEVLSSSPCISSGVSPWYWFDGCRKICSWSKWYRRWRTTSHSTDHCISIERVF